MILSLHWTAWLLIAASIVPGVAIVIAFYRAHSGEDEGDG